MDKIKINDTVKIGSYEEVSDLELSTISEKAGDSAKLNGLIIRGYETKFNKTNENGQQYARDCFDEFIEDYFVKNKLNMPLTIQHRDDLDHLAGRVLILEVNSVGFYFVAYIPKTYKHYEDVKNKIQEGILQGFSKEGWATDFDYVYTTAGDYDYTKINKMAIYSVSLVSTPANSVSIEKVQEIKEGLTFKREEVKPETIEDLFT